MGRIVETDWQQESIERLLAMQRPEGGWAYRARGVTTSEATSLACMALSHTLEARDAVQHGLDWLAHYQRSDGGVPIAADIAAPCWPTGLAVLAWLQPPDAGPSPYHGHVEQAISWLCRTEGLTLPRNAKVLGHDTTLIGWPWVQGTHSWLEPTAYATWALRQAGLAQHRRTREGVAVLLDRVVEGGGWNYGNRRVYGKALRPFPATTGLVLRALASEPRHEAIDRSIRYLTNELRTVRVPMSLGWGLIGLGAWRACPPESAQWLAECAQRITVNEASPVYEALLLMASHALAVSGVACGEDAGE